VTDLLVLAGQVLLIAVLTGLVTYGLMLLASRHPWLQVVVLIAGLVYGIVAGAGAVVMKLVVHG
jgi:hypothetical protein